MARIYLLSLLLLMSVSCSRSLENKARLSFQFKESVGSSASTGYFPAKIIINVRYDGQTYFQEWDCPYQHREIHGYDVSDCKLPSSITLAKQFPSGPGRLIQVLMVSKNADDTLMEFSYSDKSLAFTGGQQSVIIGESWNTTSGLVEGTVQGRLVSTANPGLEGSLSGRVIGYYQPEDSSKPAMEVIHDTIFAGWFDFMFLNNNVKLTYKHKDSGTVLFNKKSLEDIESKIGTNDQVIKVNVPAMKEVYTHVEDVSDDEITTISLDGNKWKMSDGSLWELFDGNIGPNYLMWDSGQDFLQTAFNEEINLSEVEIVYNTIGPISTNIMVVDGGAIPIVESGDTTGGKGYWGEYWGAPKNARNSLLFNLPPYDNLHIYEIKMKKTVHHVRSIPAQSVYVGFYDIAEEKFRSYNSESEGVAYDSIDPSSHYYNGAYGNTLLVETSIAEFTESGAWKNKGGTYNNTNFVSYTGQTPHTTTYHLSKVPTTLPNATDSDCDFENLFGENCIFIDYNKFAGERVIHANGPLQSDIRISGCPWDPCSVNYKLLPGLEAAGIQLEFFKVPNSIDFEDNEDVDCAALSSTHSMGVLANEGTHADLTIDNLQNERIYYCPVKIEGGTKKYFGWGDKVHYLQVGI